MVLTYSLLLFFKIPDTYGTSMTWLCLECKEWQWYSFGHYELLVIIESWPWHVATRRANETGIALLPRPEGHRDIETVPQEIPSIIDSTTKDCAGRGRWIYRKHLCINQAYCRIDVGFVLWLLGGHCMILVGPGVGWLYHGCRMVVLCLYDGRMMVVWLL